MRDDYSFVLAGVLRYRRRYGDLGVGDLHSSSLSRSNTAQASGYEPRATRDQIVAQGASSTPLLRGGEVLRPLGNVGGAWPEAP